LQLLPRSQKPTAPAAVEDKATAEPVARNAGIFGSGKPRDERDPKLAELNKHIEDVVEKVQQVLRTVSVTSNGSNDGVTKPVKILTAPTKSLTDQ
jgi:predicted component of type VI protein secretion system